MPSARELSFDVLRTEKKRTAEQKASMVVLQGIGGEFSEVLSLAEGFITLIRKERSMTLTEWLTKAESSRSAQVRGSREGCGRTRRRCRRR